MQIHHNPTLDGKKTKIMHTLNILYIGYCDLMSENEIRILYTLNIYCAQDIAT